MTVALDTALDDDLRLEGRLYDLIHEVNVLRRESGLEITDRIRLWIPDGDLLERFGERIAAETLAVASSSASCAWRRRETRALAAVLLAAVVLVAAGCGGKEREAEGRPRARSPSPCST